LCTKFSYSSADCELVFAKCLEEDTHCLNTTRYSLLWIVLLAWFEEFQVMTVSKKITGGMTTAQCMKAISRL